MRKFLSIAFVAIITSFLLFLKLNINFWDYLYIVIPIVIYFAVVFWIPRNYKFYLLFCVFTLLNLAIFLFLKTQEGYWTSYYLLDILDKHFVYYTVSLFIILLFAIFFGIRSFIKDKDEEYINLFVERNYDLERIEELLKINNVVGVNAKWGDGKSFLFKCLQKKCKNAYFFINVGVLSVTVDSVEKYILNEIDHILDANHILSSSSSKIKGLLSQPMLKGLGNVFFDVDSYTELFGDLKKDILKLNKKILLTFEDIDRIPDKNVIFKIFSIVDLLSCENIKILYQYDEDELLDIIAKDKLYLEKYIPHSVILTPIRFSRLISVFCEKGNYSNLKLDDFSFISLPIYIPNEIKSHFTLGDQINIIMPSFSIRKIQIFLEDVVFSLKRSNVEEKYKKVAISYCFMKHFLYSLYRRIDIDRGLLGSKLFGFDKEYYSIKDLCEKDYNDNGKIFENLENRQALTMLIFFGYDFSPICVKSKEDELKRSKDVDYFFRNMRELENNEKIDHLVKNLLANGKSEYTDYENAVIEMKKMVLNEPKEKQVENYKRLCEKMYHGNFEKKDNTTVFRIGIPGEFELFHAFDLYETDADQWIKLIDFYLEYRQIKSISAQLIEVLLICQISNKLIYLHILRIFNNLEIVGNLNEIEKYQDFLYKYINAFSRLGYINTHDIFYLDTFPEEKEETLKFLFSKKDELGKMKNESPFDELKLEINELMQFLQKNIDLIKSPQKLKKYELESGISTRVNDYSSIDRGIQELSKLSNDELKKKLYDDYKSGKYMAGEIIEIWKKLRKE